MIGNAKAAPHFTNTPSDGKPHIFLIIYICHFGAFSDVPIHIPAPPLIRGDPSQSPGGHGAPPPSPPLRPQEIAYAVRNKVLDLVSVYVAACDRSGPLPLPIPFARSLVLGVMVSFRRKGLPPASTGAWPNPLSHPSPPAAGQKGQCYFHK